MNPCLIKYVRLQFTRSYAKSHIKTKSIQGHKYAMKRSTRDRQKEKAHTIKSNTFLKSFAVTVYVQSILAYFRIIQSTLLKRYDSLFILLFTQFFLKYTLFLLFIQITNCTDNGEIQIVHNYLHSAISKSIVITPEIMNSVKSFC